MGACRSINGSSRRPVREAWIVKKEKIEAFLPEIDKAIGHGLATIEKVEARERGLAGATVLRGLMGFGAKSHVHTAKILRLSSDLPVVIEIVDTMEKIEAFLPEIDKAIGHGLATIEKVEVRFYRDGGD